jgi:hypothetical protein
MAYQFKPGQTLGVVRDSTIGDLIAFGESLESPNHKIHLTHIVSVVNYGGMVKLNEMLEQGDTMTDPKEYDNVKFVVLEPKIWWSQQALDAINAKANEQHSRKTKYDWITTALAFPAKFIQGFFRVKNPKWMSKTTDERMECAEKGAILFNTGWAVDHKDIPYSKPGEVNPDNYVYCGYQKIVYKNF